MFCGARPTQLHVSIAHIHIVQCSTARFIRDNHDYISYTTHHVQCKKNEWWNDILTFQFLPELNGCWFTSLWYWRSLMYTCETMVYVEFMIVTTGCIICDMQWCVFVWSVLTYCIVMETNKRMQTQQNWLLAMTKNLAYFLMYVGLIVWHRGSIIFEIGSQLQSMFCCSNISWCFFADASLSHSFFYLHYLSLSLLDHKSNDGHPNPTDPPRTAKEW